MNPIFLMVAFFVTVMGLVTVAGYALLARGETGTRALIEDTLLRVGQAIPAKDTPGGKYRKNLMLAGYRQAKAFEVYLGLKLALIAFLVILCGAARLLAGGDLALAVMAMGAGAGIGYLLPDRILAYLGRRRAEKILFSLPAAIDILVLSLEAGQSLDASLADTARELRQGYPELSAELNQVQLEMPASQSRADVFRGLADRNSEPELKRLAQVFLESDRFGTRLAPALRNHVKYLRIRLRQQAYEQARKISVKLVFPVFFLIFPSVILVTLGPAIIQVYSQLNSMLK